MHWPIGMKLEPKVPLITFTSVSLLVILVDWIVYIRRGWRLVFCLVVYSSPQSRQESRRALISTIASIFSWICLFLGFVYLQVMGLNISTSGGHYHSSYWVCCRKSPNPSCSKSKYLEQSPNYEYLSFFLFQFCFKMVTICFLFRKAAAAVYNFTSKPI